MVTMDIVRLMIMLFMVMLGLMLQNNGEISHLQLMLEWLLLILIMMFLGGKAV